MSIMAILSLLSSGFVRKALIIGVPALVLLAAVGFMRATIAAQDARIEHLKAERVTLRTEVKRLDGELRRTVEVNQQNITEMEKRDKTWRSSLSVLQSELDRVKGEKAKVKVVRQVIHEKAQACTGDVHPSIGSAVDWLRSNPDSGGGAPAVRSDGSSAGTPAVRSRASGPGFHRPGAGR